MRSNPAPAPWPCPELVVPEPVEESKGAEGVAECRSDKTHLQPLVSDGEEKRVDLIQRIDTGKPGAYDTFPFDPEPGISK